MSRIVSLTMLVVLGFALVSAEDERPNIVLIMVDDMGFSDPGCMGGEVQTPHIDSLAHQGLVFTNFANNGKCLPTRQSLFLGHYARHLDASRNTELSYAMKAAGYGSYMAGKVHGHTRLGWDRSVTMFAADSHWQPKRIWVDGISDSDFLESHPEYYSSDTFTDYALKYLDFHQAERPEDPFFLYLAFSAPHDPLHAPVETIARYGGVYEAGWDAIRQQRFLRMQELDVFGRPIELAPKDADVPTWETLSPAEQAWEAAKMRVHAAMVDRIDQNIGRVLDKLRGLQEYDNTLVIFLSDNGANRLEYGDPQKGSPGAVDSSVALGKYWAWASNTPFKGYKSSNYEGGGHAPMICHWPARIIAGSKDHDLAHITDITATCLELAGLPTQRILGKSLTLAFQGQRRQLHTDGLGFGFKSAHAWRNERYKLVRYEGSPWQLYDMMLDPTEIVDLAEDKPDMLEKMRQQWLDWNQTVSFRGQPEALKPAGTAGQELTLIELKL